MSCQTSDSSISFVQERALLANSYHSPLRLEKVSHCLLFSSQELNLLIGFSSAALVISIASLKKRDGASQAGCLWRFSFRTTISKALEVTIEMSAAPQQRGGPHQVPLDDSDFNPCDRQACCCCLPAALNCHWDDRLS